ncbi:cobaltochelatase subunit CobN, partial [uncultured Cetobacterium sp.]|uniref:cobaltochelatase subunit CobN n=1 Tax=uncultured Cetobacterium sp. TaxID=527638 RepID=UPI002603D935
KNINDEIKKLIKSGISDKKAKHLSKMRVFGCPPGTYGAGVDFLINSQKWESRDDLGKAYIKWSGYSYGKDYHGEETEESFLERMKKTDITIKNESSVEIDMLESDDYFTYHGGLTAAVKKAKGSNPKSYIGDTSDPLRVDTRDLNEESARIMRARVLNPKWIDGLKKHGYKGAQEMSSAMDIVFGWDATSEIIEDWMYSEISETYVENDELREWIQEKNPHALLNITEKLLEAESRDMWDAPKEQLNELRKIYLKIEGDIEEYED